MFQIIVNAKRQRRILYTPELYRKRYKFRVLIKLDQAEELEHIKIGVTYGTISTLSIVAE